MSLIVTAQNITKENDQPTLARTDGTADYRVWVGINEHCIWKGRVFKHKRDAGAAQLLRQIADTMEACDLCDKYNAGEIVKSAFTQAVADICISSAMHKAMRELAIATLFGTGKKEPVGILNAKTGKRSKACPSPKRKSKKR